MRAAVVALMALLGCGARTEPGEGASAARDAATPATDSGGGAGGPDAGAGCPDGGTTPVVYVLDDVGTLWRYDPADGGSTALGAPSCGDSNIPWTMTATAEHAYIVYTDWTMAVVSLPSLACAPTSFESGQLGLEAEFGVAAVGSGAGERIYYYGLPSGGAAPILAVSDTVSFALTPVGNLPPSTDDFPVNLTADGAGHLYAFSPLGQVQEIDPASATVLQTANTGVTTQSSWATIAYGSSLFLWVGSDVVGYDLATGTQTSDVDAGVYAIGASAVGGGCSGP